MRKLRDLGSKPGPGYLRKCRCPPELFQYWNWIWFRHMILHYSYCLAKLWLFYLFSSCYPALLKLGNINASLSTHFALVDSRRDTPCYWHEFAITHWDKTLPQFAQAVYDAQHCLLAWVELCCSNAKTIWECVDVHFPESPIVTVRCPVPKEMVVGIPGAKATTCHISSTSNSTLPKLHCSGSIQHGRHAV
jgi:hypothetical protein